MLAVAMTPTCSPHVTLTQVATTAGVSPATASYSLRNDPRIPRSTAKRVLAVAEQLGYRPNPWVSALMAHIRRSHPATAGERIAFLWIDAAEGKRPYKKTFEAAQKRAFQLGYLLEEFWFAARGMSSRRMEQILTNRGITGVLISPRSLPDPRFQIAWEWSRFSSAIIGTVEGEPELHHSAHHHYGGMRLALRHLQAEGKQRIVGLFDPEIDERARRAWSAAFQAHHPLPERAREFLLPKSRGESFDLVTAIRRCKPEALVGTQSILEPLLQNGWTPPAGASVSLLDWTPNPWGFGGVDQGEDVVAMNAVDLVVGQLEHNERGVPEHVKMLLSAGRWISGKDVAT